MQHPPRQNLFFEGALWRRRQRKARKPSQPCKVPHGVGPVCAKKGPPGAWWRSSETHFTRRTSGTLANSRSSRRGSETHVTRPTAGTLENSRSSRSRRGRFEAELGAGWETEETRPTAGTVASESTRRGAAEVRGEGPGKCRKVCSRVHASKVFANSLFFAGLAGVAGSRSTAQPGQHRGAVCELRNPAWARLGSGHHGNQANSGHTSRIRRILRGRSGAGEVANTVRQFANLALSKGAVARKTTVYHANLVQLAAWTFYEKKVPNEEAAHRRVDRRLSWKMTVPPCGYV